MDSIIGPLISYRLSLARNGKVIVALKTSYLVQIEECETGLFLCCRRFLVVIHRDSI